MKTGRYKLTDNKIGYNPRKMIFTYGKRKYEIQKLDHNNLEYIIVNKKIYYLVTIGEWLFIFEGKTFTLEKGYNIIYNNFNIYLLYDLFYSKFYRYIGDNIIFSNPFNHNIILKNYGIEYSLNIYNFSSNIYLYIMVPDIPNKITTSKALVKKIKKFVKSKKFYKKLGIIRINTSKGYINYLKYHTINITISYTIKDS